MKCTAAILAVLAFAAIMVSLVPPAAAQGPEILIWHTSPAGVTPGRQIYLSATLTNATDATIAWRNDTMTSDGIVPMTNLSEANGTGWVFAAYLPAQPAPTQITYAINASNGGGFHIETYFFSVDLPPTVGLTPTDQEAWVWTMAASLSMIVSTFAVLYWYTGRRLLREVR